MSLYFLSVHGRIDPDPDGAFSLCFQFSPFDDGGSVDVVSKCDVVDKPAQMSSNSAVIEAEVAASNVGHDNAIEQGDCSNLAVVSHPIDWESLLITPLTEEQIGTAHPVMDEDLVYEFVGLRAEDERAEQTRMAAQNVTQLNLDDMELQDAHLAVHDHVPGEDSFVYDQDDPPMEVGTIYASMDEFRDAVRQHAIKRQFQLVTKKSRKDYFHGRCSHEACSWNISARLIKCDGQQVMVLTLLICSTLTLFIYMKILVLTLFINMNIFIYIARYLTCLFYFTDYSK